MPNPRPRIFYGWWLVVVSVVVLMASLGLTAYSFGVFLKPLSQHFGWSRAAVSAAMSVFYVVMGLAGPAAGRLTDKYGPKRVMIAGAIIAGAIFLLLSRVSSLWHLYLLYALLATGTICMGLVPNAFTLSRWFNKKRGLALGIATSGIGLGGWILVPIISYVVNSRSWHAGYIVDAILLWVIVIPLVALVMKTSPQEMGLLPYGEAPEPQGATAAALPSGKGPAVRAAAPGLSAAAAARTPAFWALAFASFVVGFGVVGYIQHQVASLTDMGVSATVAALALSFTAGIGVPGRVVFGYLADRVSPRLLFAIAFVLEGSIFFIAIRMTSMVWPFVIVWGFGLGGLIALRPLLVSVLFGIASYGSIIGWMEMLFFVGAAAGTIMAGWLYDVFGNYFWAFTIYIIGYALAAGACVLLVPPKSRQPAPSPAVATQVVADKD